MKTSKEIKPFKMRCESKEEIQNAINILRSYFRMDDVFLNGETILILTIGGIICTRLDAIGYFEYRDEPELAYSEFMGLYGKEEEGALEFEVDYSIDCEIKTNECDKYKPNDTSCYGCIKARYKIKTTND